MSHHIEKLCGRCGMSGHHSAECLTVLGSLVPAPCSDRPWRMHWTGSDLSLKDAKGKTIFKKVVSKCSPEEFEGLKRNFFFIAEAVNAHGQNSGAQSGGPQKEE